MNDQRKEPTLSSALDADLKNTKSVVSVSRSTTSIPPSAVQQKGSPLLWLLVLLLVFCLTYAAWILYQGQQQLQFQQKRIGELEKQLSLAGNESIQSLSTLSGSLTKIEQTMDQLKKSMDVMDQEKKRAFSEIDKLWAARNVQKQTLIDLEKEYDGLKKQDEDLVKNLQSLEKQQLASQKQDRQLQEKHKQLQRQNTQLEKQSEAIKKQLQNALSSDVQQNASPLSDKLTEQALLLQSLRERHANLAKQLTALRDVNQSAGMSQQFATLSGKIREHEEAIVAFDAFRRTINREILVLKQRTGSP